LSSSQLLLVYGYESSRPPRRTHCRQKEKCSFSVDFTKNATWDYMAYDNRLKGGKAAFERVQILYWFFDSIIIYLALK